jgi:hypothetical protein
MKLRKFDLKKKESKDSQIQTEERKLNYVKKEHQEVVTLNSQLLKSNAIEKRQELKILKHKQEIERRSFEVETKLILKVKMIEEDAKGN